MTYAFMPLDPAFSKFIRGDYDQLKHRKDIKQPAARAQSFFEKGTYGLLYHALVVLTVIVSSVTILTLPKPYASGIQAQNHAFFFASLLPLGKLLISLKYMSKDLDFYGPFWDFILTIIRITLPMTILTKLDTVNSFLSYLLYFDSSKPLPNWITYSVITLFILIFALIIRAVTPNKNTESSVKENFTDPCAGLAEEQAVEENISHLLQKAKDLLHTFQKSD
jgi:hypothetical protein